MNKLGSIGGCAWPCDSCVVVGCCRLGGRTSIWNIGPSECPFDVEICADGAGPCRRICGGPGVAFFGFFFTSEGLPSSLSGLFFDAFEPLGTGVSAAL